MTAIEFSMEMNKLMQRFGQRFYPPEVLRLIWNEVNQLGIDWLRNTTTYFLNQHKPPLSPEFRERANTQKSRFALKAPDRANEESMFSETQNTFLFALTKKVAGRGIKNQNEVVDLLCSALQDIIMRKDKQGAQNLFCELSGRLSIPYNGGLDG